MKKRITITIDKEVSEWIIKESMKKHLTISTFINQLFWETKNHQILQ